MFYQSSISPLSSLYANEPPSYLFSRLARYPKVEEEERKKPWMNIHMIRNKDRGKAAIADDVVVYVLVCLVLVLLRRSMGEVFRN